MLLINFNLKIIHWSKLLFSFSSDLLSPNKCDLEHIQSKNTDFDIVAFSKSRLIKDIIQPTEVSSANRSYEFSSSEASSSSTSMTYWSINPLT